MDFGHQFMIVDIKQTKYLFSLRWAFGTALDHLENTKVTKDLHWSLIITPFSPLNEIMQLGILGKDRISKDNVHLD